jgi:hypothetical protein
MSSGDRVRIQTERKIIVLCEDCFQKLRIPKEKKKLRIRCPNCKHEFDYTYNAFGFSPSTKKHLLIGLVGGFVGFLLVELVQATVLSNMREPLLSAMLAIGAFGVCLGAVMGAGEGFFKKNRPRMYYGLKPGALLGLISGVLSGLIAQVVYASILSPVSADTSPSIALLIFARNYWMECARASYRRIIWYQGKYIWGFEIWVDWRGNRRCGGRSALRSANLCDSIRRRYYRKTGRLFGTGDGRQHRYQSLQGDRDQQPPTRNVSTVEPKFTSESAIAVAQRKQ